MSLVNVFNSSIVAALGGSQFSINYMTTTEQALEANQHLAKSDDLYHQGDFKGAVDEFYSAFSPTAEDDEKKTVIEYLNTLLGVDKAVSSETNTITKEHIHCLVFTECQDGEAAQDSKRGLEVVRGGDEAQQEFQKRAPLPWIFHQTNRIARRFVMDLAHAFAVDYFGEYLRGNSPRNYGYNGAFLSWHENMPTWNSATAQYYVENCLITSHNAAFISARTVAAYPRAAAYFCVSNRPTGC